MKPTDFSKNLRSFFANYLPNVRNLSGNTISSYRDAFRLLLIYCQDIRKIKPEKLCLEHFDEDFIISFLEWLQTNRGCSISTRNQRLVAIHAFFRYVQVQEPVYLHLSQHILQIPCMKHSPSIVKHLTPEQVKELLATPNSKTESGRRDITLLSVLYDTGARVQELCDLRVRDVRLDKPAMITLTGKGRKTRSVPILGNTIGLLKQYLMEKQLSQNGKQDNPLFFNQQFTKLTRSGVSYILQKYTSKKGITPHILRHSKAMHLYQAGVNLIYIRDILGHVDIATTDIYARQDIESKRRALEDTYPDLTPTALPDWNCDDNLLNFLNNL